MIPIGGAHVLYMNLFINKKEPSMQITEMLVIRHRQVIILFPPYFEERVFLRQDKSNILAHVRSLEHKHNHFVLTLLVLAFKLYLDLLNDVLVRPHFNYHTNANDLMFLHLYERASRAPGVLQVKVSSTEHDLRVRPRYALLHYHDLVNRVAPDFPALFVQFIVGGLSALGRHYDDFVLDLNKKNTY
jgi:hypothetical protein